MIAVACAVILRGGGGRDEAAAAAPSERFLAAVALAQEVHGDRRRTGTEIPYMAHLLVVTGLVLEDRGDKDQAIAAMLHDSVEDGGGRAMLERIEKTFGRRVAAIVGGCSDTVDGDQLLLDGSHEPVFEPLPAA